MSAKNKGDDILAASFLREMMDTTQAFWRMGWAERNAGNISLLLERDEAAAYLDLDAHHDGVPLAITVPELAGRILLITGTGSYFRNIGRDPASNLGAIRISGDGAAFDVLWGFANGGGPTSELPSHLLGHSARLEADPAHRVFIHTHPTELIALTAVHSLDERSLTRTLWRMHSECLVVLPDGVGVLPWLTPGTDDLGLCTGECLRECRLVVWPLHGIVGTGRTLAEAQGLIETVEKSASLYLKARAAGGPKNLIGDRQLKMLAERFGLRPRPGVIRDF